MLPFILQIQTNHEQAQISIKSWTWVCSYNTMAYLQRPTPKTLQRHSAAKVSSLTCAPSSLQLARSPWG